MNNEQTTPKKHATKDFWVFQSLTLPTSLPGQSFLAI